MTTPDFHNLFKRSLDQIADLRSQLDAREHGGTEPIAIIGLGCRFPGGASLPDAYWQALVAGVDAVREVPSGRWPADPDLEVHSGTRWAGFLDDVDRFDAAFFGISPREAASLDPQQRLLLEVTWESLEDAGQVPAHLVGSRTGVFVGVTTLDYQQRIITADPAELDIYSLTGNNQSFIAGRLSYVLGLQGPTMAVDTACSSSLVAVHLACQSLRSGDSELALAGGVNLILSPLSTHMLAEARALSPSGRCRAFDAGANGFVRGEGCGVVVLKRLGDARRDGDRIWAVIRGSAVNHDGRSTGLTTPNVLSQQALLRQALARAGVTPAEVGYVETHGTGTPLGDPIEAEALKAVLGQARPDGAPCVLGAVKTNLGHLEAAAGVAGLIKVVLSLHHEEIPRNLNFETLNPLLSFDGTPFVIPALSMPWPRGTAQRVAGVSSFGFSGTNAHVVVSDLPAGSELKPSMLPRATLLPLSARSPEALRELAGAYVTLLRTSDDTAPSLVDVAHTASMRRSHHAHRLSVAGVSRAEIADGLEAFVRGTRHPALTSGVAAAGRPRIAFVFPGMGTRCEGVARSLLDQEPVFRQALDDADQAIGRHASISVRALIEAGASASDIASIDTLQPFLFAVEVALAALWRSWGVSPDAVIGHSMGEIAAACVAGALSLDHAAQVVCSRSRLLRHAAGRGAMAVIEQTSAELAPRLAAHDGRLVVAVSNTPRTTVVSGEPDALDELLWALEADGIEHRRLKVDIAFHSPQMDPLCQPLRAALHDLEPTRGDVPLYSTVTGGLLEAPVLDAAHWVKNLREPVQFSNAIERLIADGYTLFVEVGPRPSLLSFVNAMLREDTAPERLAVATLHSGRDERVAMLSALGALYTRGYPVSWAPHAAGGRCVSLPAYPWQRERYWIEPVSRHRIPGSSAAHPFLGTHLELASPAGAHVWQATLDHRRLPYLAEHREHGVVTVSGAVLTEMIAAAAAHVLGDVPVTINDLSYSHPLSLAAAEPTTTQISVVPAGVGILAFTVASHSPRRGNAPAAWLVHVTGRLHTSVPGHDAGDEASLAALRQACPEPLSAAEFYWRMDERGNHLGSGLRNVARLWRGPGQILAEIRVAAGLLDSDVYRLHPAVADACVHVLAAAVIMDDGATDRGGAFVGGGVAGIRLMGRPRGSCLWSHVRVRSTDAGQPYALRGDIRILDESGQLVAELAGVSMLFINADAAHDTAVPDRALSQVRERVLAASPDERRRLLAQHLRVLVADVLELDPERLPVDNRFQDLGIDSLMIIELRDHLRASLGLNVPSSAIWLHPSLGELAAYLADHLTSDLVPAPTENQP
jgi:acyl transferase domain-containing protein